MDPVVDHRDRLRGFLMSQFRGTVVDALVGSIGAKLQEVEDDHFDLWLSSQLQVAGGPLLNQWGKMVGEARGGLDDDDYRVFIYARILLNLTDSNAVDVQSIAELVTAPSEVRIYPYLSFGYQVVIVRDEFMGARRAARVARFLRACKPGGLPIDITEQRPGDFGFLGYGLGFGAGLLSRAL